VSYDPVRGAWGQVTRSLGAGHLRAAMRRTERGRSHEFRRAWCRMIPCAEPGGRSLTGPERPSDASTAALSAGKKEQAANPLNVWDAGLPGGPLQSYVCAIVDPPHPEVHLLHNAQRNTNMGGVCEILGVRGPPQGSERIFLFEKNLACAALWVQQPVVVSFAGRDPFSVRGPRRIVPFSEATRGSCFRVINADGTLRGVHQLCAVRRPARAISASVSVDKSRFASVKPEGPESGRFRPLARIGFGCPKYEAVLSGRPANHHGLLHGWNFPEITSV